MSAPAPDGAGLEDLLRRHFPRVQAVLLDFFHAAEHLSEWAKALHPDAAGEAVCHLRALVRSENGQWDADWASLAG